jgi:hypothetical protein
MTILKVPCAFVTVLKLSFNGALEILVHLNVVIDYFIFHTYAWN